MDGKSRNTFECQKLVWEVTLFELVYKFQEAEIEQMFLLNKSSDLKSGSVWALYLFNDVNP